MHTFLLTKPPTPLAIPCASFLWAGKCCSNWYTMWYNCHPTPAGPGSMVCNPGTPHWGQSCAVKGDTDLTKSWLEASLRDAAWTSIASFLTGEIILSTSFPSPLATFCSPLPLPFLGTHWVREAMGPLLTPAGAFKECYDTLKQCTATWHEVLMNHLIYPSID